MKERRHDGRGLPPCGLIRRLLAAAYDSLIVLALLLLAGFLALPFTGEGPQALRDPGYTAFLALVWFLYLGGCWRRAGATVGMRAWRIRLATADGLPPSWGRCLVRFIVGLLSAAACGLGFWWALLDSRRRTWHDRASATRPVVHPAASNRAPQHPDRGDGQQQ